jgi:hypothetical protein
VQSATQQWPSPTVPEDAFAAKRQNRPSILVWPLSPKMLLQVIAIPACCMAMIGVLLGLAEYNVEIRGMLYGIRDIGGKEVVRRQAESEPIAWAAIEHRPPPSLSGIRAYGAEGLGRGGSAGTPRSQALRPASAAPGGSDLPTGAGKEMPAEYVGPHPRTATQDQGSRPALVPPSAPGSLVLGSAGTTITALMSYARTAANSPMEPTQNAPQGEGLSSDTMTSTAVVTVASKLVEPSSRTAAARSTIPIAPTAPVATMPMPESKPSARRLSPQEAAAALARGDAVLSARDVTSARLFYRLAADSGEGTAALRLGETFDPAFLAEARLGRMLGDLHQALHWYRRARDLGNSDAEILLRRTESASK